MASRTALAKFDARKGFEGRARATVLGTAVSRVTITGVVVPSEPMPGVTVQIELTGAPVQLSATFPERPLSELSCNAYVTLAPLPATVALVTPAAVKAKSMPVPESDVV